MTKRQHAKKILDIALSKLPDTRPNTQEHKRLNMLITDCYNELLK